MSRVEDQEIERYERAREQQKIDEKNVANKRVDAGREFQAQMVKAQAAQGETQQKNQRDHEQQGDAQRQLLARRGIASNQTTDGRISRNAKLNDEARSKMQSGNADRAARMGALANKQVSHTSGETRAVTRGSGKQRDGDSESHNKPARKDASKETEAQRSVTFAQVNQVVGGIDSIGARAGSLGGPIMQPSLREIIDRIVAGVRQGIDKSTGYQTIQVELHDEVLGGAKLTFVNTQMGIHLSMETGDKDVEKLLSSGQSAHELSQAMKKADVNLLAFQVNEQRVL